MNEPEKRDALDERSGDAEELAGEKGSAEENIVSEENSDGQAAENDGVTGETATENEGAAEENDTESSSGEDNGKSDDSDEEKKARRSAEAQKKLNNIRSLRNRPKKHKKLKVFLILVLILILGSAGIVVYNIILNQNFTVTFYQVRSDKVSDNIRIVELADLHNKEYGEKNEKLIETIRDLKPDLIFYAGDMMNYGDKKYTVLFDLSDKLSEIAPIYACYGNNELSQFLFKDKSFYDKLTEHHVNLLSNEAVNIEIGKSVIQLVVVSDNADQFDIETNNSKKFLEGLEPTSNCRICLTHYPELFLDKLLNRGIDIAFTGHAHGGLIRIPKIGGLYSTGEGFLPKLTSGVVGMKDGAQVVISRGLGDSSAFPRINNQPELVVVDICWY